MRLPSHLAKSFIAHNLVKENNTKVHDLLMPVMHYRSNLDNTVLEVKATCLFLITKSIQDIVVCIVLN